MTAVVQQQYNVVFMKNDVISWDSRLFRVIQIQHEAIFLFELNTNKGVPKLFDLLELESLFFDNEIKIIEQHCYSKPPLSMFQRDNARAEALERYDLIKDIVEADDYLISSVRGRLINEQAKKNGKNKVVLYRLIREYWSYGQSLESLATFYQNCGAPGKQRVLIALKPGPKSIGDHKRLAVRTSDLALIMSLCIDVYYLSKKENLSYTYRRFVTKVKSQFPSLKDDEIPNIESLRNILKRYFTLTHVSKKRRGDLGYNKDVRPLIGTAAHNAMGPGMRFEIDATVADVVIVSRYDRTLVIGRPTIYLVLDVFSRLVVGFYIGWHNPSYRLATIALIRAVEDKSHLLKKYKIPSSVCSAWPAVGLPEALLSDKAELFGLMGSNLAETTNMRIENTGSGRADAKGVVERYFPLVTNAFGEAVPGKPTKAKATSKKSGAIDARQTAVLTMDEFESAIIWSIVLHNNQNPLKNYDCEPDMPDEMSNIPINNWNWGMQNRTGMQSRPDVERVKLAVLPRDKATVNKFGVRYKGLVYNSEDLRELSWFDREPENSERPGTVEILYDPMTTNQIYVVVPNRDFPIKTSLIDKSRAFCDLTFAEAQPRVKVKNHVADAQGAIYNEEIRKHEEQVLKVINAAKKEKKSLPQKPLAQTKREVEENRRAAKEEERKELVEEMTVKEHVADNTKHIEELEEQDEFANLALMRIFNQDKDVNNEANGFDDE